MTFALSTSPASWIAVVLAIAALAALARSPLRKRAKVAIGLAIMLMAVASTGPTVQLTRPPRVVVMVDYSASTRSADYRTGLHQRLLQLLPQTPDQVLYFAEQHAPALPAEPAGDLPGNRTTFAPPPADAIVLFSDGQFDLPPAAPPTFVVLDDGLRAARDARISGIVQRSDEFDISLNNSGEARTISVPPMPIVSVPHGPRTISVPVQSASTLTAQLNPGDRWPENDAATIAPAPAEQSRLWIGDRAPAGFTRIDPAAVISAGSMIGVWAIVLDDVPAATMAEATMRSLDAYVRDLGGTLIINGGANSFGAGGWTGTRVDAVSPLASSPPSPQRLWVILVDSSGSMAGETPGGNRLKSAVAAARAALNRLPPDDLAMIGTFAEQLSWLTPEPAAVREVREQELSPPEPRGPTNLAAALNAIVSTPGALPRELLIITDGETAGALTVTPAEMTAAKVRPGMLLIGPRDRATALIEFIEQCAGTVIEQTDPTQWIAAAQQLARVRQDARLLEGHFSVELNQPIGAALGGVETANETWVRSGATALGTLSSTNSPAAATWQAGAGKVVAFAFAAAPPLLADVADRLGAVGRDPRFQTRLIQGENDIVQVTAIENGAAMNELQLTARNLGGAAMPMEQVGPGRYEIRFDRQVKARVVEIIANDTVVDRVAVAGRYAAEFDAIGLNLENLRELAARTGGAVIEPTQTTPIQLSRKTIRRSIASWLAATAAALMLVGLILQHRSPARV